MLIQMCALIALMVVVGYVLYSVFLKDQWTSE
jgi:hypothetical protein